MRLSLKVFKLKISAYIDKYKIKLTQIQLCLLLRRLQLLHVCLINNNYGHNWSANDHVGVIHTVSAAVKRIFTRNYICEYLLEIVFKRKIYFLQKTKVCVKNLNMQSESICYQSNPSWLEKSVLFGLQYWAKVNVWVNTLMYTVAESRALTFFSNIS